MKNIKSISYQYTGDFKNPINYFIQTGTITTSIGVTDALEIAFSVIDSLGGDYDYLENLVENFEKDGIKIEVI